MHLAEMVEDPAVRRIEDSQSGNAVINHFANELVTTGYLHNHARMWFATWWVQEARLPWQSGAAFFYQYLLNGDPASNTLSWRWVAGLQTPGKTYLARRSNLEKYITSELLDSLSSGLAAFEEPQAFKPEPGSKPPITRADWPLEIPTLSVGTGLWIHEEDLSVENSKLGQQPFSAVIVTADADTWECQRFPTANKQWIADALEYAATRAERHWRAPAILETRAPHGDALLRWARLNNLQQVAALRPEVGPLSDSLPTLRAALAQAGFHLILIDRPEDQQIRHFTTAGSSILGAPAEDSRRAQWHGQRLGEQRLRAIGCGAGLRAAGSGLDFGFCVRNARTREVGIPGVSGTVGPAQEGRLIELHCRDWWIIPMRWTCRWKTVQPPNLLVDEIV